MSARGGTGRLARVTGLLLVAAGLLLTTAPPAAEAASTHAAAGCNEVTSTAISPSTVRGGDGARQTVTLTRPARQPFEFVTLQSYDYTYDATSNGGVRVPGGQTSVSFPVHFLAPGTKYVERNISASVCSGYHYTNPVTVLPLDPAELAVQSLTAPPFVVAGHTAALTLQLSAPARSNGTAVRLNPDAYGFQLGVDAIQVVPAGQRSLTIPLRISGDYTPRRISFTADLGTSTVREDLIGVPAHLSVTALVGASGHSIFLLGLGRAAPPGGARVAVSIDQPDVHAPAYVTVPAGARGGVFDLNVDRYPNPRDGTITVRWDGHTDTEPFGFS